jgi:hypothetical protein
MQTTSSRSTLLPMAGLQVRAPEMHQLVGGVTVCGHRAGFRHLYLSRVGIGNAISEITSRRRRQPPRDGVTLGPCWSRSNHSMLRQGGGVSRAPEGAATSESEWTSRRRRLACKRSCSTSGLQIHLPKLHQIAPLVTHAASTSAAKPGPRSGRHSSRFGARLRLRGFGRFLSDCTLPQPFRALVIRPIRAAGT